MMLDAASTAMTSAQWFATLQSLIVLGLLLFLWRRSTSTRPHPASTALDRSEATFAAIFRSNPCAMAITLFEEGTILEVNDILLRQSGYKRSEIVGSNSDKLGFWADASERLSVTAELDAYGRVETREVRWRAK